MGLNKANKDEKSQIMNEMSQGIPKELLKPTGSVRESHNSMRRRQKAYLKWTVDSK